jgi:molybdenum cofactor sulfurtransferase
MEADMVEGIPVGIVRVTIGAVSTLEDIDALVECLSRNVVEQKDHLQAAVEIYSKKNEWIMGTRCPSTVWEMTGIRIEPTTSRREKHASTSKPPRRIFPWLGRRRGWLSALMQTSG